MRTVAIALLIVECAEAGLFRAWMNAVYERCLVSLLHALTRNEATSKQTMYERAIARFSHRIPRGLGSVCRRWRTGTSAGMTDDVLDDELERGELGTTATVGRPVHRSLASVLYPSLAFAVSVLYRHRFRSSC